MYTKNKEFQIANKERKIELIEMDAYNSMINYLEGNIQYAEIQNTINELSSLALLNKKELKAFLKKRVTYEAYQCSLGENEDKRNQIRKRMMKLI